MGRTKLNPAHSDAPKKQELPLQLTEATEVVVPPLPPIQASDKDRLSDETEFAKNTPRATRPNRWSPCDDI